MYTLLYVKAFLIKSTYLRSILLEEKRSKVLTCLRIVAVYSLRRALNSVFLASEILHELSSR